MIGDATSFQGRDFGPEGLEALEPAECLRLLGTVPVGRLVFHEAGLPAVRLVNFVVDEGSVLFRTKAGQKYAAALRGDVVAFEADEYDSERHLGWTVTAVGHAWAVTGRTVERRPGRRRDDPRSPPAALGTAVAAMTADLDTAGLSDSAARRVLERHGPNTIPQPRPPRPS